MHRIFGAQGKCLQPNDLTILHRRFFFLFNNIVNLWLIFIVLFFSMENEKKKHRQDTCHGHLRAMKSVRTTIPIIR